MPNDPSIEPVLSESQQAVLSALLDTLVPASADGGMPSAAEVGFDAFLRTQARDFVPELLSWLDELGPGFAELAAEQIVSLPMHPYLSEEQLRYVVDAVNRLAEAP